MPLNGALTWLMHAALRSVVWHAIGSLWRAYPLLTIAAAVVLFLALVVRHSGRGGARS